MLLRNLFSIMIAKNQSRFDQTIMTKLTGLDLFTCAAQESDHTKCCNRKRVQRTAAGDKCLAFCNLAPESPRFQADASYLPCWAVLNEVKSCFVEKITKG